MSALSLLVRLSTYLQLDWSLLVCHLALEGSASDASGEHPGPGGAPWEATGGTRRALLKGDTLIWHPVSPSFPRSLNDGPEVATTANMTRGRALFRFEEPSGIRLSQKYTRHPSFLTRQRIGGKTR